MIKMKWMGLNELREKYLTFFEGKEHLRIESFPLIPKDDNSLLLINSGMAPMKKYFTGEVIPPSIRVATCQKCIRTPDIERVGITSRHGTFFEMLGNFSFGEYFKKEATQWAWEFFTEVLEIPSDRLYVSVYEDDDEAYNIWKNDRGLSESHIVRMGKEDNFWEHGSGPCGPCSEIYFDRGEKYGCNEEFCEVGCECDRYVEVWNLVFTQFISDGNGNYEPMPRPNIDTGMGLERLACIMQDVDNLFLVDTIANIMKKVSGISGVAYGSSEKSDISLRVITDHIRSTVFMIGDGILPSNEGRGYVLRRLFRRAARHGRLLNIRGGFLAELADTVIEENKDAYPQLTEKRDMIKKVIAYEEEVFARTINQGMEMLNRFIESRDMEVLSGEEAFVLSDTYGFPLDLTREILAEKEMSVDEDKFYKLMDEQRARARNARKNAGTEAWEGEADAFADIGETEFVGYTKVEAKATVLRLSLHGKKCERASEGDEISVALKCTPFYAQSGGQAGDTGTISSDKAVLEVVETVKNAEGAVIHHAIVKSGEISQGDEVTARIDINRREATMRCHTAAHLLQAALREVLGTHVEQAGQMVDDRRVRFDFTHFSAMSQQEIDRTQELVNNEILKAVNVDIEEMSAERAKSEGAMALFGEKYGDVVRVVSVGDFSKELCGGTHVKNTSRIGLFKIISESSVASGIRRIEAVTGENVIRLVAEYERTLRGSAQAARVTGFADIPGKIQSLTAQIHDRDKEIEKLQAKLASTDSQNLFKDAVQIGGVKVITAAMQGANADALRTLCDKVKERNEPVCAVLAGGVDGKVQLAAVATKKAQEMGISAGAIVKEVAIMTGGNGGGRPDFAMAGVRDREKLAQALMAVQKLVEKIVL